jgi:large conductance mechanosensitive channel
MNGNVMDMAVGVIIAGAFGKIVTSLVDDVLMPAIRLLTGGIDLSGLEYHLPPVSEMVGDAASAVGAEGAVDAAASAVNAAAANAGVAAEATGAVLKYGAFIQNIIDFLIIAFCIFLMIKAMNKLMPKKEEPEAPAGPTQEELLTDIRDLLKKQQ